MYIKELINFCTENNILYSINKDLEDCNKCTFKDHLTSDIVIYPFYVNEIQLIIKKVNELKVGTPDISIHTVSTGNNWGYGSATPTSNNTILMNLSNLYYSGNERVTWVGNDFDDEPYGKKLGIVRVTASATQNALYWFLQNEGGEFWMDATGASKNSSIVGNYLERGFGHTSMGDHFQHVVGMEVILADGTLVKTGHAGCKNAANVGIHKHGIGPSLDGIFSQSSLGIVTAIYIELMPAKQYIKSFFIQFNDAESFYASIEKFQKLKANGVLTSQMHCGNANKGIQTIMRYPFSETNNETPLPNNILEKYKKYYGAYEWTITGCIYANSYHELKSKCIYLKHALKGIKHKKIMMSDDSAEYIHEIINSKIFKRFFPKTQKKLFPKIATLKEIIKLKKGIPTDYFMESVYWRKREIKNITNPDADNVGMIWVAPIAPMTKENIKKMVNISTTISEKYNFEPAISITLLNERAADCILSIVYDRDVPIEEENALLCYDELIESFNRIGFTSYRASTRSMINGKLNYTPELSHLHKMLKDGLDGDNLFGNHYI